MPEALDRTSASQRRAVHLADLIVEGRASEAQQFLDALTDDEARAVASAAVVTLGEAMRALVGASRGRALLAARV